MKLFLLTRIRGNNYDMTEGLVIAAASPQKARRVAAERSNEHDDLMKDWLQPTETRCRAIGEAAEHVKEGLLLEDHRAG